MSVGFAGYSDGWRELSRNYQLNQVYERAENRNVALTGEVDIRGCGGQFILALGFGDMWVDAAERTRVCLMTTVPCSMNMSHNGGAGRKD
jgi:glucoamylase